MMMRRRRLGDGKGGFEAANCGVEKEEEARVAADE